MKTIKFRGKQLIHDKWRSGGIIQSGDKCFIIEAKEPIIDSLIYQVEPSTVGQFTGFIDSNGRNIYEGDILLSEKYQIVEVVFEDGVFSARYFLKNEMQHHIAFYNIEELGKIKVVGNIHDNTELMKGNQDESTAQKL